MTKHVVVKNVFVNSIKNGAKFDVKFYFVSGLQIPKKPSTNLPLGWMTKQLELPKMNLKFHKKMKTSI